jgi:hypothetical protein
VSKHARFVVIYIGILGYGAYFGGKIFWNFLLNIIKHENMNSKKKKTILP